MQQNTTIPFLDLPLPLLHEIAHRLPIQTWHSIHLVSCASNEKWKHVENSNSILKQRILDRVSIKSHPISESFRSKFIEIIFSEDFLRCLTLRSIDLSHYNELDSDNYQRTSITTSLNGSDWSEISPFSSFLDVAISYARGDIEILKRVYMHKEATDIRVRTRMMDNHFLNINKGSDMGNFLDYLAWIGNIQQDVDIDDAFRIATANMDTHLYEKVRKWAVTINQYGLRNGPMDLSFFNEDDLKMLPYYTSRVLLNHPYHIQNTIWDNFPDDIKKRTWRLLFFRLLTSSNLELATIVFNYGNKYLDSHSKKKLSFCPNIIPPLIQHRNESKIEWLDKYLSVKFEPVHLYIAVVNWAIKIVRFLLYEKNINQDQKFLHPRHDRITCVQFLMRAKEGPEIHSQRPLLKINLKIMKLFLDHPNFDTKYLSEEAPFEALQYNKIEALKVILSHPKYVINDKTYPELSRTLSDSPSIFLDTKIVLFNQLTKKFDQQQTDTTNNKRKRDESF